MEIHQLIFPGEINENVQHFKYMSDIFLLTYLGGLMVECKPSYLKVTGLNTPYISMGLYLKLCLTKPLPPPPPG